VSRANRLDPVVKVAKSREDTAARELAAYRALEEQQETQLDTLLQFRAEYGERFHTAAHAGMSSQQFHDYREFLSRLDAAIEHQRQVLRQAQTDCERSRQRWAASRAKSRALDKVIAQQQAQAVRAEARRDQMDSDERAQRMGATDKVSGE
jgi:flagellar FliJ protein